MKILNLEGRVIKEIEGDTLRGANLWSTDLERANLKGADLMNANLENADLEGANLRGADLRGTIYCPSKVLYYWTAGLIK